ncbi:DUF6313 family protein [Streptomyces sp. NPDC087859]|uniref:DUF6313 family protein n=1 Tax=Streptomyces sp. NPDC087859 TaxID=3365812 RepID=UPI00382D9E36
MVDPPLSAPPDTGRERARDWFRSLSRLNRAQYWLLTRAVRWCAGFGSLYVLGSLVLGWGTAYEVMIGIKSPRDTLHPELSVVLSVTGWLLVPAFVGGAAGYLVSREIDSRRSISGAEVLDRMRSETDGPGEPPAGGGA